MASARSIAAALGAQAVGFHHKDVYVIIVNRTPNTGVAVVLQAPDGDWAIDADRAVVRVFYEDKFADGVVTRHQIQETPLVSGNGAVSVDFPDISFENVAFVRVDLMKQLKREEVWLREKK